MGELLDNLYYQREILLSDLLDLEFLKELYLTGIQRIYILHEICVCEDEMILSIGEVEYIVELSFQIIEIWKRLIFELTRIEVLIGCSHHQRLGDGFSRTQHFDVNEPRRELGLNGNIV